MKRRFGAAVRERRIGLGLGQKEVAEGICTTSYVNLIERGRAVPRGALARELASRLGLEPDAARAIWLSDVEDVAKEVAAERMESARLEWSRPKTLAEVFAEEDEKSDGDP